MLSRSLLLCLLALGLGGGGEGATPTHANITAWVTFSTHDLNLVASQHQNNTIFLVIRGTLSDCINLNFTYDLSYPTIVPLEDLIICPHQLSTTWSSTPTSRKLTRSDTAEGNTVTPGHTSPHPTSASSAPTQPPLVHPLANHAPPPPLVWNGSVEVVSRRVGKTTVGVITDHDSVDVVEAFVRVSVIHTPVLDTLSDVVGWVYTMVWIISFVPQVYLNWRRKSVEGFSLDNVTLNIIAYLYYSLYNAAFLTIPLIKAQFQERYPRMVSHVRPNDLFFSVFSFLLVVIQGIQCTVYHRAPGQTVSWPCRLLGLGSIMAVLVACVLAAVHTVWWLDVFYLMSYLKLGITPLKYIPQIYVDYKRKSTKGFSIKGVMMDFSGGVMSLAQMFLLSANNDDWLSIFTNFSKFGLGLVTLLFDAIFFLQHYYYDIKDNSSKDQVLGKGNKNYRRADYKDIDNQ